MSKIEWTGNTWNPVVGCSVVSPGCTNCYAMRMAARLESMAGDGLDDNGYAVRGTAPLDHYRGLTRPSKAGPVWTGKVAFAEAALMKPLRRKAPTTYFVNSMSDLFHEDVPDEWIDRVFAVMSLCPQHTFQVLTKRSARMRAYFAAKTAPDYSAEMAADDEDIDMGARRFALVKQLCKEWNIGRTWSPPILPLDNVWLGVSCEDQRRADERIPDLLATPAAVRFVSAEPLLGPIDFTRLDPKIFAASANALDGKWKWEGGPKRLETARLDWVIVGGESGHGARPMQREWADSIVSQCRNANVACFVKQLGAAYCDEKNGVAGASIKVPSEVAISSRLRDRKGGDMGEWPEGLRVREMPVAGI